MTKATDIRIEQDYCCANFRKANDEGTDNEQYGPAISGYQIGIINDLIKFCPWCGQRMEHESY